MSNLPGGIPNLTDIASRRQIEQEQTEVEQYISNLETQMGAMQQQRALDMAYGPAGSLGKSNTPNKEQLEFLYNTQPKKKDYEENFDWDSFTIDCSEVFRHWQLAQLEANEANWMIREYDDVMVLREQTRMRRIAEKRARKMYAKILISKAILHEGRPTALEHIHAPTNKTEYVQKLPAEQPRRSRGFWSPFFGGGR